MLRAGVPLSSPVPSDSMRSKDFSIILTSSQGKNTTFSSRARKVAAILDVSLLEGPYDVERWLVLTLKFKDEPEKGRRCDLCYAMRLQKTAMAAPATRVSAFSRRS